MKNKNFLMNGIILASSIGILGYTGAVFYERYGPGHQEREMTLLQSKGFENIEIKGAKWFCPSGTTLAAKFEATKNDIRQEGDFCHNSLFGVTKISMK